MISNANKVKDERRTIYQIESIKDQNNKKYFVQYLEAKLEEINVEENNKVNHRWNKLKNLFHDTAGQILANNQKKPKRLVRWGR